MGPADLDGVVETFAPAHTPLHRAFGLSQEIHPTDAPADAAFQISSIVGMGGGVIRRDVRWREIEPTEGQFDFAAQDRIQDAIDAAGLETIGIIDEPPMWATMDGSPEGAPKPDKVAAFSGALAAHFRGRVAAWEIWNEENAGYRFWQPREDPAAYADALVQSHDAIVAADPAAKVVLGGLFYLDYGVVEGAEPFLEEAYLARPDLGHHFDALGLHPYARYPPKVAPEEESTMERSVGRMISRTRALLAHHGDGDKPIWVTEVGWPVFDTIDEAAQARYLVRATVEALAAGAERVCLFTLRDGPHPEMFPPEQAFGLLHHDGTQKPAYGALHTLLGLGPNAVLTANRSTGGLRDYTFSANGVEFRIFYSTDGNAHTVDVSAAHRLVGEDNSMLPYSNPAPASPDPHYALP